MKKILFILGICLVSKISFCQSTGEFKKSEDGTAYKIVSRGGTEPLKFGEYLSLHFTNILSRNDGDSILNNTRDLGMPQFMQFDSMQIPPVYLAIFKQMKVGDSVCSRTSVDSMFKKNPEQMPTFMKMSDFVYTNISIENVYKTEKEYEAARQKSMDAAQAIASQKSKFQAVDDDLILSNYLKENSITAVKTTNGVYIATTKVGVGPKLTNKQFVKIKYTGKTLNGKVFDTNMDESKGHTEPLTVNLTNDQSLGNGVIPGMTEALLTMQKGTKATMYLPSGLAYGARGAGADIPANANLIFELEVLSVQSIEAFKASQKATGGAVEAAKDAVKTATKEMEKSKNKKAPLKKPIVKKKK